MYTPYGTLGNLRRATWLQAGAALLALPGLAGLALASGDAGVNLLEAVSALALLAGFAIAVRRRFQLLQQ